MPDAGVPQLSDEGNLDGRAGDEVMVEIHSAATGGSYRIFTFYRGVFRTMDATAFSAGGLGGNSVANVGSIESGEIFGCVRPGVVAEYGFYLDNRTRIYHVSRQLYRPRGIRWIPEGRMNYTVKLAEGPLGRRYGPENGGCH